MTGEESAAKDAENTPVVTADELRAATAAPNRNVALMLVAVTLVFLAGAFGVGLLALYGPF